MKCPVGETGGPAGWIIGEATPLRSTVLFNPQSTPRTGMYLLVETPEGCALGVVERIYTGNLLIQDRIRDAEDLQSLSQYPDFKNRNYTYGSVQWVSLLDPLVRSGTVRTPSMPPPPAGEVYAAGTSVLKQALTSGSGRGWVRLGTLASNSSVEFSINVNRLTRHLAILAVTGGGKSNTVCVLAHRIVGGLSGTMVIFDIHGEYAGASSPIAPGRTRVKQAKINPLALSFSELRRLARIPENAHNQERILRQAYAQLMDDYRKGKLVGQISSATDYLNLLKKYARSNAGQKSNNESLNGLLNRIQDIEDYYLDVLDPMAPISLDKYVEPGMLNIIDLSDVDEYGADAVVSHYLRRLLEERKRWRITGGEKGYPVPIITVVEEAHVLIPREEDTLTRYWAGRIAREGRKFGVGLVLVSQRPKNVDQDVLSQTNNKIILRIVEPQDQRYVQAASEQLSEDLMSLLPGLNPGEAIVIGSMTRIPAMVKIDLCPVKTGGADIDVVSEWARYSSSRRDVQDMIDELA